MKPVEASSLPQNKTRNRFKNIKCCKRPSKVWISQLYCISIAVQIVDETRVVLTPVEGVEHDYINANIVDVSNTMLWLLCT